MDDTVIDLRPAPAYRTQHYGITHEGVTQHRVTGERVHNPHFPHRITVWSNVGRLNPHPGVVKPTEHGPIGGDGRYLDPSNKGTDSPISVTLGAGSIVVAAHHTAEDLENSREGVALAIGQQVRLRYPDGTLSGRYTIVNGFLMDPWLVPVE